MQVEVPSADDNDPVSGSPRPASPVRAVRFDEPGGFPLGVDEPDELVSPVRPIPPYREARPPRLDPVPHVSHLPTIVTALTRRITL
jgi:hypothetical protein